MRGVGKWLPKCARYSFEGRPQLNLLGTAEDINARLREYVDAGATKFVFNPACGADEMLNQMKLQAEAIVQPIHQKLTPLGSMG